MSSLIKKASNTQIENIERCHEGEGALIWRNIFSKEELHGRRLRFLHDNVLEPSVSIGEHQHSDDEEYYVILSGTGVMTLDGQEYEVTSGDVTGVFPGGSHALKNTGSEDMRILVFSVEAHPN